MAKSATKRNEGDKTQVVSRAVTADDRKTNRYFTHMAGLTGTIENMYEGDENAVKIDLDSLTPATREVHELATTRMRKRVVEDLSEEAKKHFTKEELDFDVHYVLLVNGADLEAGK